MITVVVVKMGSAPRPSLANGCGGGRRSWVRQVILLTAPSPWGRRNAQGALEMLGGVEEVDELDALGKHAAHVIAAEEVELPVMARAIDIATLADLVVVASDLSEVLSVEGDGEVVEDCRMPIPFETSDGC